MRRKSGVIALWLCLALCLGGCRESVPPDRNNGEGIGDALNEEASQNDHVFEDIQNLTGIFPPMNAGIRLDVFPYLQFRDLETERTVAVCPRVGCTHKSEDVEKGCTAARFAGASVALLYQETIYLVKEPSRPRGETSTKIYACATDGTDVRELYDFGKDVMTGEAMRVGECLYFWVTDQEQDMDGDGRVFDVRSQTVLYCLNLQTERVMTVHAFPECCSSFVGRLEYSDGYLFVTAFIQKYNLKEIGMTAEEYFSLLEGTDEEIAELDERLGKTEEFILVSVNDQTVEELPLWTDLEALDMENTLPVLYTEGCYLGVSRDTWLSGGEDTAIYRIDIRTGETVLWKERKNEYDDLGIRALADGFMVTYYDGYTAYAEYYDSMDAEPYAIHMREGKNLSIRGESDTKLYVAWTTQAYFSSSDEWEYEVVDKAEFLGFR